MNDFITMASGTGSDVPPIDVLELHCRDGELKKYNNRTVPYLLNCDCGRDILVAYLVANNKAV